MKWAIDTRDNASVRAIRCEVAAELIGYGPSEQDRVFIKMLADEIITVESANPLGGIAVEVVPTPDGAILECWGQGDPWYRRVYPLIDGLLDYLGHEMEIDKSEQGNHVRVHFRFRLDKQSGTQ